MAEYAKALEASPDDGTILSNIGNVHLRAGRFAQAIDLYRQAVPHMSRPSQPIHLKLAIALAESGQPKEALEEMKRGVAIEPRSPDAHYNLAILYERTGDTAGARREYQEVIRLHGDETSARGKLAALDVAGK